MKYPDALIPVNGSESIVRYLNVSTHDIGGVSFEGVFPGGAQPGKLVYFGFPFETIYPADSLGAVMSEVLGYLLIAPSITYESGGVLPEQFELMQNFPNPFNPRTTLRFGIPEGANVSLVIHNLRGQTIKTLVSNELDVGWYEMVWNGDDDENQQVATGLYLGRLQSGEQAKTVKMLYLK